MITLSWAPSSEGCDRTSTEERDRKMPETDLAALFAAAAKEILMPARYCLLTLLWILPATGACAADRFFGFNNTTSKVFTGVYLAPHETAVWGPNQALNDKDKTWEPGERLMIKDVSRSLFDLKVVDRSGRTCIKHAVDLAKDTTFEIRDEDLRDCKH